MPFVMAIIMPFLFRIANTVNRNVLWVLPFKPHRTYTFLLLFCCTLLTQILLSPLTSSFSRDFLKSLWLLQEYNQVYSYLLPLLSNEIVPELVVWKEIRKKNKHLPYFRFQESWSIIILSVVQLENVLICLAEWWIVKWFCNNVQ